MGGLRSLLKTVRDEQIDIWYQLPQSLGTFFQQARNIFFAKLAGVKWTWGYAVSTTRLFSRAQVNDLIHPQETQRLLDLLMLGGVPPVPVDFRLPISDSDRLTVAKLGVISSLGRARKPLGINPGAKRPANRWPIDRFADIAKQWTEQGGYVVIFGGEQDRALGETISAASNGRALNLCGRTSLLQSAEALRHCGALLTNDTGTMHLAAAVGTPSVVAFSARDFLGKWQPWGDDNLVVRRDVPCSPCFKAVCPYDNLCLRKIGVDEIWNAIQAVAVR